MPTLEEAIDEKYGQESDDFLGSAIHIYVPKGNPRNVIPSLLVLNDCNIDAAGSTELKAKCHGVRELDLAQNRLNEWSQVESILQSMPNLNFVNLSFNNLAEELTRCDHFPDLRSLVLNSTHVNWRSVSRLVKALPNLEELHLSFNDFNKVDLCDGCENIRHNNMKKLHFTGNLTSTWKEVSKLGDSFPQLEQLVLAECPIKSLDPLDECSPSQMKSAGERLLNSEGNVLLRSQSESLLKTGAKSTPLEGEKCTDERLKERLLASEGERFGRSESECESAEAKEWSSHHYFRHVQFLNLNYTSLSSWDDVDRLGKFPALQYLRLHGCPLFENSPLTEHERRQVLIARLGNVKTLNGGGPISSDEREDAERAFIRHYLDTPESERPDRYADLLAVHGKLDPLVNIDLTPEKKVTVKFTCKEVCETRSLLLYQTVSELKQRLDGFCGIPARRMRLFYVDQEMKDITGPEEMRFPNKQLYSYNISNGDEIIVDSKLGTCKSVP